MVRAADISVRFNADFSDFDASGIESKVEDAVDSATKKVEDFGDATDEAAGRIERMEAETDRLSKTARKLGEFDPFGQVQSLEKFQGQLEDTNKEAESLTKQFGDLFGEFGANKSDVEGQAEAHSKLKQAMQGLSGATDIFLGLGLYRTFGAATQTMGKAIQAHAEFNKTIAEMNSLISGSTETLRFFREELLTIAQDVPTAPSELGAGAYQVLSAGILDASKSTRVMETAAKTAAAGLADTQDTAKALVSILNAYDLQASDSTKVSDLLFKTVKRGIVRMEDLNTAMSNILPVAAGFNVRMEELFAAIQTMTKSGVPATKATRFLRQAIQNVVQPSEQAKAVFEELGIEWGSASLQASGLFGKMQEISRQMGLLKPEVQRVTQAFVEGQLTYEQARSSLENMGGATQSITEIFTSRRGLMAAINLTGKQLDNFQQNLSATENAEGAMNTAFERATDTIHAQTQIMKNNLMRAFQGAESAMRDIVDAGVEFSKWLAENRDLVEDVSKAAAALAAQLAALFVIKKVTDMLEVFSQVAIAASQAVGQLDAQSFKIISRFSSLVAGVGSAVTIFEAFSDGSEELTRNLRRVSSAFAGVAVAAEAFKATMTVTGNPVLAAVLGVAAGGTAAAFNLKGLRKLEESFRDNKTAAEEFKEAMKGTTQDVQRAVRENIFNAIKQGSDTFVDRMDMMIEKTRELRAELEKGAGPTDGFGIRSEGIESITARRKAVGQVNEEIAQRVAREQGARAVGPGSFAGAGASEAGAAFQELRVTMQDGEIHVPARGGEKLRPVLPEEDVQERINELAKQEVSSKEVTLQVQEELNNAIETSKENLQDNNGRLEELTEAAGELAAAQGSSADEIDEQFIVAANAAGQIAKNLDSLVENTSTTETELTGRLFNLARSVQEAGGSIDDFREQVEVETAGGRVFFDVPDFFKDPGRFRQLESELDFLQERGRAPGGLIGQRFRDATPRQLGGLAENMPGAFQVFADQVTKSASAVRQEREQREELLSQREALIDPIAGLASQMDVLSDETAAVVETFSALQSVIDAEQFLSRLQEAQVISQEQMTSLLERAILTAGLSGGSVRSAARGAAGDLTMDAIEEMLAVMVSTEQNTQETADNTEDTVKSVTEALVGGGVQAFVDEVTSLTSGVDNLSVSTQALVEDMKKLNSLLSALQFLQLLKDLDLGPLMKKGFDVTKESLDAMLDATNEQIKQGDTRRKQLNKQLDELSNIRKDFSQANRNVVQEAATSGNIHAGREAAKRVVSSTGGGTFPTVGGGENVLVGSSGGATGLAPPIATFAPDLSQLGNAGSAPQPSFANDPITQNLRGGGGGGGSSGGGGGRDNNVLTPFASGGVTPGAPSSPVPAMLHGGELVLPARMTRKLAALLGKGGSSLKHGGTFESSSDAFKFFDEASSILTRPHGNPLERAGASDFVSLFRGGGNLLQGARQRGGVQRLNEVLSSLESTLGHRGSNDPLDPTATNLNRGTKIFEAFKVLRDQLKQFDDVSGDLEKVDADKVNNIFDIVARLGEFRDVSKKEAFRAMGVSPGGGFASPSSVAKAQESLTQEQLMLSFGQSVLDFAPKAVPPQLQSQLGGVSRIFAPSKVSGPARGGGLGSTLPAETISAITSQAPDPFLSSLVRRTDGDLGNIRATSGNGGANEEFAESVAQQVDVPSGDFFNEFDFSDDQFSELAKFAIEESGLAKLSEGMRFSLGNMKEIISLFFRDDASGKSLDEKASDLVGAITTFEGPLQAAVDNWSMVNSDMQAVGVSLSEAKSALDGIGEVRILDSMLNMLQSLRTVQETVDEQTVTGLGAAIENTQRAVLTEGERFVRDLATDDPEKLARTLAEATEIEQNIDRSVNNNIVFRISGDVRADPQEAAEFADMVLRELRNRQRERGGGVRR